ncbi:G patch domain-containing protein 2-like isoform X1 [Syngnathus scovelli]|uniref:G patch domain-containing protein 2-like isoform X1 n=1 Tax=Syngnathus scovelli TaxID=161590 RepID=UPI002110B954|nr:G patch domain-containing protein 2-like isoform X1 [Syngnathus scovelli]
MDELAQDLVSALEQTSEQFRELWEEMLLSPLNRNWQVSQRKTRKHRRKSSGRAPKQRPCWMDASESSSEEAPQKSTASVVNLSDSGDVAAINGMRLLSWPDSDSIAGNKLGQPLRKKRKAKRMSSHIPVRLRKKLKVSGREWKQRPRLSRLQHPSSLNSGLNSQIDRGRLMGSQSWKTKISLESAQRTDEIMSESETSSVCSSDTGLFTNDEGRQGTLTTQMLTWETRIKCLSPPQIASIYCTE